MRSNVFKKQSPNEIEIKFHDFQVSDFTQTYIYSLMQEILDEAPYGSKLSASFTQYKDYFKATVQIQSEVGPFFESIIADGIEESAQKLLQQMNRRLLKWKEKRFAQTIKSVGRKYENKLA